MPLTHAISSDRFCQLDDRYFKGLEGQYEFSLHFRLQKDGDFGYIVRSHGNYLMRRSVSTDLPDLEAGTYSVLMKITAKRFGDMPKPEDTVRKYCRSNQEKLLQVGLAYDLAHARGQTWETEEERREKLVREARRKAMEKQKQREELREYRYKQWLVQKKQNERNKKRKQKEDEYRRKRESRKGTSIALQPGGSSSANATTSNENGVQAPNRTASNAIAPINNVYATQELPLRINGDPAERNMEARKQASQPTYCVPAEPNYSTRNSDIPYAQKATARDEYAAQAPPSNPSEPTNLADRSGVGLERPPSDESNPSTLVAADLVAANSPSTSQNEPTTQADSSLAEQQAMFRPTYSTTFPEPTSRPSIPELQESFSPMEGRAEDEQWVEENNSRDAYPTPESTQVYGSQAQEGAPARASSYDAQQVPESNVADYGGELLPNIGNANEYCQSDTYSVMSFDSTIDSDLDFDELRKTEPPPPPPMEDDEDDENAEYANDPWNAVCVVGLRVFSKDPGVEIKVLTPKTGDEWDVRLDLDDPSKGPSELI